MDWFWLSFLLQLTSANSYFLCSDIPSSPGHCFQRRPDEGIQHLFVSHLYFSDLLRTSSGNNCDVSSQPQKFSLPPGVLGNIYLLLPPMLNPIVYSLKTKQICIALRKSFKIKRNWRTGEVNGGLGWEKIELWNLENVNCSCLRIVDLRLILDLRCGSTLVFRIKCWKLWFV